MAACGLPLLVHGEFIGPGIDIFDREALFIECVLAPLMKAIPDLRVVMEHISTREAVEFVTRGPPNIAATITPQHILFNRNAIFHGGLRPHFFCMPVLKKEEHRKAVLQAAASGNPSFLLELTAPLTVKRGKKVDVGALVVSLLQRRLSCMRKHLTA
jgi:dihydroorotase